MDYCGYFTSDDFKDELSDKTVHFFIPSEELEGKVESRMECDDKHCYLYHLDVVPESRNKGIGTCVIKEAEDFSRDKSKEYLNASIGVNHEEGERGIERTNDLFKDLGFEDGLIGKEDETRYGGHWIFHFHKELD